MRTFRITTVSREQYDMSLILSFQMKAVGGTEDRKGRAVFSLQTTWKRYELKR